MRTFNQTDFEKILDCIKNRRHSPQDGFFYFELLKWKGAYALSSEDRRYIEIEDVDGRVWQICHSSSQWLGLCNPRAINGHYEFYALAYNSRENLTLTKGYTNGTMQTFGLVDSNLHQFLTPERVAQIYNAFESLK